MSTIKIKPATKGSFTKAAKASGQTVAQKTTAVLKPGSKASVAMKKKAQFAKNAKSWGKGK